MNFTTLHPPPAMLIRADGSLTTETEYAVVSVSPYTIAQWMHCGSGMEPLEIIAWLADALNTRTTMDPGCEQFFADQYPDNDL